MATKCECRDNDSDFWHESVERQQAKQVFAKSARIDTFSRHNNSLRNILILDYNQSFRALFIILAPM